MPGVISLAIIRLIALPSPPMYRTLHAYSRVTSQHKMHFSLHHITHIQRTKLVVENTEESHTMHNRTSSIKFRADEVDT